MDYVQRLRTSVDLTTDPCNSFYEYACGSFNRSMSFYEISLKNLQVAVNQLTKQSYLQEAPTPVQQVAMVYNKCVSTSGPTNDSYRVDSKMLGLASRLGVPFPALAGNSGPFDTYPDPTTFGAALGYLQYAENMYTFAPGGVGVNSKNPHGGQPYTYFVDQPSLMYADIFYQKVWAEINGTYFNDTLYVSVGCHEF